ncbi:ABC transporter permease [Chryseolinea soli]|uniref:ABC transporter permease n=1 Tax=Chryseolinea soli TaxID=2321403 RepID=A0A385STZ0_9BACT|nr:ABC transporter permease [Chryseolinea soli]AYB35313.1 ABC transporter permease [Chryseolinea soli]
MQPPRKAVAFLRWFCREDCLEEIEGDLMEVFKKEYENSPLKAKWKYTTSVMKYFRPEFMKSFKHHQPRTLGMYQSYFKIGWRNLLRNKSYSIINILGLAIGIACCLLSSLYIFHELSYDRFHKNANRIVRATTEFSYGGKVTKVAVTGTKVLPEFKRVFPEVESGVRLFPAGAVVAHDDKLFREQGFVYTDSSFFNVFSFHLLEGNPRTALNRPDQVVLTVSMAKKYFGDKTPLGKTLQVNNSQEFVITGIVEDCPPNSQIKFDMLASWSSLTDPVYTTEGWFDASHYTYLLLHKPGMHEALSSKIPAYFKAQDAKNDLSGENYLTIRLQPLTDVHLRALVEGGLEPGSDYRYVYIFSIIALFILIIAAANYINLTTARASDRAKEVGLRKTVGALPRQLIGQFISESLVVVTAALIIGLLLVAALMPAFSTITGRQLTGNFLMKPESLFAIVAILLVIGLLGGFYPSLVLSRFAPANVLKGNFNTRASGITLRKSLIVIQFVISMTLITSTLVIHSQMEFIQNKKLGYQKDHIVVLRGDRSITEKMPTLKSVLLDNTEIQNITTCNQTPVFIPGKYNLAFNDQEMLITGIRADKDFVKTMGLTIIGGTDFTEAEEASAFARTDTLYRPVMLNETAARSFEWTPEEAVGKVLTFQGRRSMVTAVVDDFHFSSLHESISPFIIFMGSTTNWILVRTSGNHVPETLHYMATKWNELAPHLPFEYEFLDDQFNKLYSAESKTGKLFYAFAILGIGLACLGLFGLVTFMAQQRTKEIGIRKILGSSLYGLIMLLSKDFLKLVVLATLIAFPLGWWAMDRWLQGFAYRVSIHGMEFTLTFVITFTIASLTMSAQVIKAALANPAKSLRTE